MEAGGLEPECKRYRRLVQQAREILIEEWAFSVEEANSYMYEVAQARKLLVVEVAGRIVAGEWVWTEVSQVLAPADVHKWLDCW
jgi:hypothetical protein